MKKVLVQESAPSRKHLIAAILKSIDQDIEHDWVTSADEAREALAGDESYDLVICENAFEEAAQSLRPGIPCIALSSDFAIPESRERISRLLRRGPEVYSDDRRRPEP